MRTLAALVSMFTSIVGALTAIWSAFVATAALILATVGAITGFHAWRRELRGTTKYHAAHNVLKAVYRLRDALHRMRLPGDAFNPLGRSLKDPENHHVFIARNLWTEYTARLRSLGTALGQLQAAEHEALPLLGPDASESLDRLMDIAANLQQWAEQFFPSEVLRAEEEPQPERTATMQRLYELLYYQGEKDFYGGQIEDAVKEAVDGFGRWIEP